MSSDQGSETPSFGDLFDDPHAPLLPVDPAGRGSLRPSAPVAVPAEPVEPVAAAEPVEVVDAAPEAEFVAPFGDASDDATGAIEPVPAAEPEDQPEPADESVADQSVADQSVADQPEADEVDSDHSEHDDGSIADETDGPTDSPPGTEGVALESSDEASRASAPGDAVIAEPVSDDVAVGTDEEMPDRPIPAAAAVAAAGATAAPAAWDGTPEPGISSAPSPRVDTGRLYRSAGAEGPATLDAIPAIDPAYLAARSVAVDVVPESTPATRAAADGGGRGLTYSGVAVVVVSVTVLVGFAEAIISNKLGVLTGLALAASSIYAALVVRKADIWAAVVMPPLAFLAATLTAGQLTLDSSGSLLVREGYMVFRTLAVNAPWILGTTLVCLVIVLVRRRRG